MGGDGGQVIDRATMVKTRGYGLTKESGGRYNNSLGEMNSYMQMVSEDRGLGTMERHAFRMSSCWLSQQRLQDSVVACRLGNFYNKEALINALLNKSIPQEISHVRALRDVKQCLITWKEESEGRRHMVCPLSREDLDAGGSRAVVIWPSGAVVSPKALKELKLKECPVTGRAFDPEKDVVPLAPEGAELDRLRSGLPTRKRKAAPIAEESANPKAASSSERKPKQQEREDEGSASKVTKAKEGEASKIKDSQVYKKLFSKGGDGMTGTRDVFGTPVYNRGSLIL